MYLLLVTTYLPSSSDPSYNNCQTNNIGSVQCSSVTTCGLLIGRLGPLVDDLEGDAVSIRITQRTDAHGGDVNWGDAATQRVALTCTTQDLHVTGCSLTCYQAHPAERIVLGFT